MRALYSVAVVWTLVCVAAAPEPADAPEPARKTVRYAGGSISFKPTPPEIVREMLWLADVGPDDVVYDLGSGDGRIVISAARDFRAKRAVGVELDPELVQLSREIAEQIGVSDRAIFLEEDLFSNDFSEASVVTLFIGHGPNVALRARLFRLLAPGARVVSSQAGMGEWKPDKELTTYRTRVGMWGTMEPLFPGITDVPSYAENAWGMNTRSKTFYWIMPAPVAGVWLTQIETADGPHELRVYLTQRLSEVTGTFDVLGSAPQSGRVDFDIWGDRVRWQCMPEYVSYGAFLVDFEGCADGSVMHGRVKVVEGAYSGSTYLWEEEGSIMRETTDIAGAWSFVHPDDQRPLELVVARSQGDISATLLDHDKTFEIHDIYDFGGGFYFTYLYGDNGWGMELTEDSGWLIGKAHVVGNKLSGELRFYRPSNWITGDQGNDALKPRIEAWSAVRVRR